MKKFRASLPNFFGNSISELFLCNISRWEKLKIRQLKLLYEQKCTYRRNWWSCTPIYCHFWGEKYMYTKVYIVMDDSLPCIQFINKNRCFMLKFNYFNGMTRASAQKYVCAKFSRLTLFYTHLVTFTFYVSTRNMVIWTHCHSVYIAKISSKTRGFFLKPDLKTLSLVGIRSPSFCTLNACFQMRVLLFNPYIIFILKKLKCIS